MTVKVMVAPAIASGEAKTTARAERGTGDLEARARPRRRSSVYDADGREVFITLMCLKCRKMRPLSQFGLRRMADGAIRNQPWCRPCRSGAGAARPRRGRASPDASSPPAADLVAAPVGGKPIPAGTIAAQVAAALIWNK